MRSKNPRLIYWLMCILSAASAAYCGFAIVMVASLSGAPNYPLEQAIYNEQRWGLGFIASLALGVSFAVLLFMGRRQRASASG